MSTHDSARQKSSRGRADENGSGMPARKSDSADRRQSSGQRLDNRSSFALVKSQILENGGSSKEWLIYAPNAPP